MQLEYKHSFTSLSNLHFLPKNSTLISRKKGSIIKRVKFVKMLRLTTLISREKLFFLAQKLVKTLQFCILLLTTLISREKLLNFWIKI